MEIQASRLRARTGPVGRARTARSTRTGRAGTGSSSAAAWPRSSAPRGWGARAGVRPAGRDRRLPRPSARPVGDGLGAHRGLYAELAALAPSPVVELNRAVAVGMAFGPAAGLALADRLTAEPALAGYHLLPTVRGDLLERLGRSDEARAEFERAASLTRNARERARLLERARACASS